MTTILRMAISTPRWFVVYVVVLTGALTAKAQPRLEAPEVFEAAPPALGFWKGVPVGTTVTYQEMMIDQIVDLKIDSISRVMLVGRTTGGRAVLAGYSSEQRKPFSFGGTRVESLGDSGSLAEYRKPAIRAVAERREMLTVGRRSVACVVRRYDETSTTIGGPMRTSGEEWTDEKTGLVLKSSISTKNVPPVRPDAFAESSSTVTCTGEESIKVATRDVAAIRIVREERMGQNGVRKTHLYWSDQVPGGVVVGRDWQQADERQPPFTDRHINAYGYDGHLLGQYINKDRPAELEPIRMHRLYDQWVASTRASTKPAR